MRVVLDTNILVSLALGGGEVIRSIAQSWRRGDFVIETCQELLDEFAEVIERPHLKPLFKDEGLAFIKDLLLAGEYLTLKKPYPTSPDPDDAYLLAMLRDSEAEVLVTGDKALLGMNSFEGKRILSPASFMHWLEHHPETDSLEERT